MPEDRNWPDALPDEAAMHEDDGNAWRLFSVGRLLTNALRRFETRMFDILAQSGHVEARLSHLTLTRNLDVKGTRASELSRRAGISKQAMSDLIQQCENLGLVERQPDPLDARARIIRFTPKGTAWFQAFRAASLQAEREMNEELGVTEVTAAKTVLRRYAAHLDPFNAQMPPPAAPADETANSRKRRRPVR